jgi:hypothetical protein
VDRIYYKISAVLGHSESAASTITASSATDFSETSGFLSSAVAADEEEKSPSYGAISTAVVVEGDEKIDASLRKIDHLKDIEALESL